MINLAYFNYTILWELIIYYLSILFFKNNEKKKEVELEIWLYRYVNWAEVNIFL